MAEAPLAWSPLFVDSDGCEWSLFADGTIAANDGNGPFLILNEDDARRFLAWIDSRPKDEPCEPERDKARLDWLEAHNKGTFGIWPDGRDQRWTITGEPTDSYSGGIPMGDGPTLREAIDAAMATEGMLRMGFTPQPDRIPVNHPAYRK